jgi:7-cyano-7-deazaguanine synthase
VRGIVLLSGGLDSAVNLAFALRNLEVVLCLTADYGQLAARREIAAARALSEYYGVAHRVVELPFLRDLGGSALTDDVKLPEPAAADLDDPARAADSARRVWVPNRNGLLVNVAACFAEVLGCNRIITGFNREEARTFPDNSPQFLEAANYALAYSTLADVRVVSYTQLLDKAEIVTLGQRLRVPWSLVWSCYRGESLACGACESCVRLERARENAGEVNG